MMAVELSENEIRAQLNTLHLRAGIDIFQLTISCINSPRSRNDVFGEM